MIDTDDRHKIAISREGNVSWKIGQPGWQRMEVHNDGPRGLYVNLTEWYVAQTPRMGERTVEKQACIAMNETEGRALYAFLYARYGSEQASS